MISCSSAAARLRFPGKWVISTRMGYRSHRFLALHDTNCNLISPPDADSVGSFSSVGTCFAGATSDISRLSTFCPLMYGDVICLCGIGSSERRVHSQDVVQSSSKPPLLRSDSPSGSPSSPRGRSPGRAPRRVGAAHSVVGAASLACCSCCCWLGTGRGARASSLTETMRRTIRQVCTVLRAAPSSLRAAARASVEVGWHGTENRISGWPGVSTPRARRAARSHTAENE